MEALAQQIAPQIIPVSNNVGDIILQWGPPGALLLLALIALYKLAGKYDEIQNKRIEEAKIGVQALHDNTSILTEVNRSVQVLIETMRTNPVSASSIGELNTSIKILIELVRSIPQR